MYQLLTLHLVILPLTVVAADAASQILKYYFNTVSAGAANLPLYSIVGTMNDVDFVRYDSDICKAQLLYGGMQETRDDQIWENITRMAQKYEERHRCSLQHIAGVLNQPDAFLTYQIRFECELYEDGSIGGHTEFGCNGREFIVFDSQMLLYFPANHKAQILTKRWNADRHKLQEDKEFAERHCQEWITRYSQPIREQITMKAQLEVKVWGRRQPDGVMKLQCLVYGFHPRAVDVKWVSNGGDHVPSDEMSPILPHPDGTYQIRVSVEVPAGEEDSYSCHVDHSSLEDVLIVKREPDNGLPVTVIAVCAVILILAALGAGIFFYMKKRRGYKTASTSDTNSDSSSTPKA